MRLGAGKRQYKKIQETQTGYQGISDLGGYRRGPERADERGIQKSEELEEE
jgi:hypothetical protein